MAQPTTQATPLTRVRIIGTLRQKLPLYRECGVTRATILVNNSTVHLRGHDAAATHSIAIGTRVEIVGTVRRIGRRNLVGEIDGEIVD